MKASFRLSICLVILLGGCSEMFQAPMSLFQELLPLAIKYAPYALMFLEAPDSQPGAMDDPAMLSQKFACLFQKTSSPPESLPAALTNILAQRKNKLRLVVAIHLDSREKLSKVQKWLEKNENNYRIHYLITAYVREDMAGIHQALTQHNQVAFLADGPLQQLSNSQHTAMLDDFISR